ncbi:molecular chaperone DnaJ [Haloferax profundi]|uniref:Molecular chaperone DnaJ n=1 Tax=Haloferax profundi TaxID=1544718 RepID=A0A0W1RRQ7_9EURY|nr:DnaJ domain-containing protein [Haloferax profundi]KTG16329.1 molecular chaperone DnaJ [Haloferax profundi]
MPVDFYELLGVERDAEKTEIKQAFRQMAREYHPDVNDDDRATAQFTVVRKAYEVLTDETERADYDRMGHGTYVEKRLDGLTKFKFPGQAGNGSTSTSSSSSSSRSTSSSSSRSTSSSSRSSRSSSARSSSSRSSTSRSSSSRSSGRTSSGRTSSSNRSSSRTSTGSSSRASTSSRTRSSRGSSSRSSTSSSNRSSSRSSRTRSTSNSARTGGSRTSNRFERERGQSASSTTDEESGTNPLWYGWGISLVALLAYLGGLGWYLATDGYAFVTALVSIDTTAPVPTLLAASPLSVPSLAALQAAASSSLSTLLLPSAGLVPGVALLLAVSLLAVIARFGHSWTTWLYALAAAVPVAILAAGAVGVARPLLVDIVGLVVCPLVGAGGFVFDAGRYLFATR